MLREIAQEANVAHGQESAAWTLCSANTNRANALGRDSRGLELDHLAQAAARLGRLGWKVDPSRKDGTAQLCRKRVQLPDEWALSKGGLRFSDGSCVESRGKDPSTMEGATYLRMEKAVRRRKRDRAYP